MAVQDYLDGKPLMEVHTAQSFVDMVNLLPPGRQNIVLIDRQGNQLTDRAVTSLRYEDGKGVQLPVDMYIVHESAPDRRLPKVIRIDCTGLGGHDLGGVEPWHVCLRSDRLGQNIYGPSLAIMETITYDPKKRPVHTVALGLTKAMHEFLTLHYFATDSGWDTFAAGVPIGVEEPLPRTPMVFPPKEHFNPIAENYSSAQLSKEELEAKFREEESLGRMFPSKLSVLQSEYGDVQVESSFDGCHHQTGWWYQAVA